ncbi:MAG TPA: hypothetical protein VI193_02965 [Acidimicrobiia bacterium]
MMRHLVVLATATLLISACGGDSDAVITYTDTQRLGRFQIPEQWHTYELSELSSLEDLPFDEPVQGFTFPAVSSIGFDGDPVRDVAHLGRALPESEYPIGLMSVRQIGETQKDFLSRAVLTQSVLPYYDLANSQELQKEDFSFGGGFDGVRVLVAFEDAAGQNQGVAYMITVSNPDDTKMYSMIAGCSRECFISHQETIVGVVDSWLVNKRA